MIYVEYYGFSNINVSIFVEDKSEIPDREVAGREDSSILEESCIEETPADEVKKDR
jgi:hypothetical protein